MNFLEKSLAVQAQVWVFLGPCLILLSTLLLFFKGSLNLWYFPVGALIGVPLCIKWEMKGLAISLLTLFVLMAYFYPDLPFEDRYWHVGMGIALSLSLVIITLSAEEASSAIGGLQAETNSRLDHIVRLNEQWQAAQAGWAAEKEAMHQKITVLNYELEVAEKERVVSQKLASLAKDELLMMREIYEARD